MAARRNASLGGGTRAKGISQNKARGAATPPKDPTGRLVTSEGVQGGAQAVHWCPNAKKTGQYNWKCPECDQWFYWSVDRGEWYAADPLA